MNHRILNSTKPLKKKESLKLLMKLKHLWNMGQWSTIIKRWFLAQRLIIFRLTKRRSAHLTKRMWPLRGFNLVIRIVLLVEVIRTSGRQSRKLTTSSRWPKHDRSQPSFLQWPTHITNIWSYRNSLHKLRKTNPTRFHRMKSFAKFRKHKTSDMNLFKNLPTELSWLTYSWSLRTEDRLSKSQARGKLNCPSTFRGSAKTLLAENVKYSNGLKTTLILVRDLTNSSRLNFTRCLDYSSKQDISDNIKPLF